MTEEQILSEETEPAGEKLVPVAEAIRYRKRAQAAENRIIDLEKQLAESEQTRQSLGEKYDELKLDKELTSSLVLAGACDMEAAMLLARARMRDSEKADVSEVIEQLRKQKSYLFKDTGNDVLASVTTGPKDRRAGAGGAVQKFAKKAAASGSRTDVHEYMKIRRNVV